MYNTSVSLYTKHTMGDLCDVLQNMDLKEPSQVMNLGDGVRGDQGTEFYLRESNTLLQLGNATGTVIINGDSGAHCVLVLPYSNNKVRVYGARTTQIGGTTISQSASEGIIDIIVNGNSIILVPKNCEDLLTETNPFSNTKVIVY